MEDQRSYSLLAGKKNIGQRLDIFLAQSFKKYSRSYFQRLIKDGLVTVGGKGMPMSYRLREEDLIEISFRDSIAPQPEPIPLDILFEDDHILVLAKAPGMLVHPLREGQKGTLVSGLLYHCAFLSNKGGIDRPGIVHRLDRDTSGILVTVKDNFSYASMVEQFRSRQIKKEYLALVCGQPPQSGGVIDLPLGRDRRIRTRMSVRFEGGKEAYTEYRLKESWERAALLQIKIKTGRTHQIRVHLAQIGCPVLGDEVYGRKGKELSQQLEIKRQMLHSHYLAFKHPFTGSWLEFSLPPPADMEDILEKLRLDWRC